MDGVGRNCQFILEYGRGSRLAQSPFHRSIFSKKAEVIMAKLDPLPEILDALARSMEKQFQGGLCSILLCDRHGKLHHGAAPNLPKAYSQALDGMIIGPEAGSCGKAAFCRDIVIVADIATDPLWQNFRHLALEHQLRACWSAPAIGSDQQVLGTFAVYFKTCRTPQNQDLEILSLSAHIASIAIERDRTTQALADLNQQLEVRVEERTAALRESEAKLEAMLNFAPAVIYVKDLQGRHTFVNRAFLTLFNCTLADIIGKVNHDFYPPEVADVFEKNDRIVIESCHFHQLEEEVTIHDQNYTFLSHKFILFDQNQQPYALCGISNDITQRKAFYNALQRSQEQLKATLQAIPDLVFRLNSQGEYLAIYPSEYVGNLVDIKLAIGHSIKELLPPPIAAKYSQVTQTALATNTLQTYEQDVVIDGVLRHEEVRVAPCGDHEVVFVIRDISEQQAALRERQKAAATIRKSEDRFARIANNMPGVLYQYVLHPDGSHNFIYISERCQQIFGLDADTITRDANELFRLFESEDFISLKSSILLSASTLNTWSWEGKLITPFGEKKWIQGISQPEQQANGDILWDGVVVDISERKLMEIKLQKTVAELDRATRLKDEFLANMSHELRTPLNGILGMSEALKQGILGTLNPNQHHAIAMIEKSGKHLLELINDILDISKIEAGKLELYLTEVSVQELCNSSLTLVNHLAFTKQINIESNIPQQLQKTFIKVDNRRLRQVLINLLSNAVKFTHKAGKINLNVGIKPSTNLAILTPQSIYFSVVDNGIGIATDDLDKLFLPFTQIDSSLNRQYSGTGLGLALVKQIIELHGGCVEVSSQLGKGSCFTVYLPYNETSNNMSNLPDSYRWELPSYLNVINPQSPLIMLAVEKEAHLITLSSYLEAKGYSLLIARNGQEAIALIESQSPQLVVIDIQIPVLEGLAAIKYIRQNLKLTNLPIIALTAVETTGEPEKLREAGANEYLTQPIKLKHLSNLIHNLLNP